MLAGAYVTRQHKWHNTGGRLKAPTITVPLQNQQSLFKVVKHCQIKKL
jgi:hypothetical protein